MMFKLFATEKAPEKGETPLDFQRIAEQAQTETFKNERAVKAFAHLVEQLKEKLSDYETIISDDTSARLVSLFFREIINKARAKQEEDNARLYFVASGRHGVSNRAVKEAIGDFLKEKIEKDGSFGKTLLVTEFVSSGHSIEYLGDILEENGIDFDLAILSGGYKEDNFKDKVKCFTEKGWDVYSGIEDVGTMGFYSRQRKATGVRKAGIEDLPNAHPEKNPNASRYFMKDAREDVHMLARELSVLLD